MLHAGFSRELKYERFKVLRYHFEIKTAKPRGNSDAITLLCFLRTKITIKNVYFILDAQKDLNAINFHCHIKF